MHMPSLYCGWSGVQAHSTAISGVADNLANQSTTGFKSTRSLFRDYMSTAIYTGTEDVQQQGNGVYVGSQYIMTQGSITPTDNPLDMAISGQGFFTVKQAVNAYPGGPATGSQGANLYSRAGEFHLDANGFLVNPEGYVVQGFMAGPDGSVAAGALTDIQINPDLYINGATTANVDVTMNLDASDPDTHAQAQDIDPSDDSTYNYSYTTEIYDAQGDTHNIVTYYQRLDAYAGPTPPGSSSVWKAASFENVNGTVTANPPSPDNVYYLHFDTNGHLVGTSQAIPASGDAYVFSAAVAGGAANVSDRVGEELTFTGAGVAQTYRTSGSVTFSAAMAGGETVSVGADLYTLPATLNATDAANWLAEQINANAARTYFAQANAGVVTIYAEAAASLNLASAGAGLAVDDDTTLDEVVNAIDNGLAARGALDLTALAPGATVTVAGVTFTEGVDFLDAATLAGAINGAGLGVTATSNGGNGVFLTADSVGSAGNAVTLAAAGGVVASGATLSGGLDNSATTLVDAAVTTVGASSSLSLGRTDVGATATLTLGAANTLGAGLALDFNVYTQTALAADAVNASETEGEVNLAYLFGTATQDINWDYSPTDNGATTQSAGSSETIYLYQDGVTGGSLDGLSVDRWGNIIGHFSNEMQLTLAAVGLTDFVSPGELKRVGDTLWQATEAAGPAVVGLPGGVEGMGLIEGSSLESANVDLANEFVSMINYQRAYQANTKSITTSDEMLKEAINLKR